MVATRVETGIFEGLTYEQYDAIEAYRRSVLMAGLRSMAHLKEAIDHPDTESTEALLFGQALHVATLEPDRFEQTVVLGPINPKTGEPFGADTKACREFAAENPDKIVVAKGFREKILGMGRSIRRHPSASKLIRSCQRAEVTMVWNDPVFDLPLKARPDGVGVGLLDLKSSVNASPESFPRSIYDYGYDIQAAMDIDGWKALMGEAQPLTLVVVEKEPPYAVALYCFEPDDDWVKIGRQRYREILAKIQLGERTGEWPGYGDDPMFPEVPEWIHKRFCAAAM